MLLKFFYYFSTFISFCFFIFSWNKTLKCITEIPNHKNILVWSQSKIGSKMKLATMFFWQFVKRMRYFSMFSADPENEVESNIPKIQLAMWVCFIFLGDAWINTSCISDLCSILIHWCWFRISDNVMWKNVQGASFRDSACWRNVSHSIDLEFMMLSCLCGTNGIACS